MKKGIASTKVYCKSCKYLKRFIIGCSIENHYECKCPENKPFHDPCWYEDRLVLRKPKEINATNECTWFVPRESV